MKLFKMEEGAVIIKSASPMQAQRQADGSPYTRHGHSGLRPAGPRLYLEDVEKSSKEAADAARPTPKLDPSEVVKAYLGGKHCSMEEEEKSVEGGESPGGFKAGMKQGMKAGQRVASIAVAPAKTAVGIASSGR